MTGVRVANDTINTFPASIRFRPLRDQIIVEKLDWEPSKILETVYSGKALRGIVKAVGPGRYPIRYDGPKGKRTKSWESKAFRPCDVKVGDVVELGGLEIDGYLHMTILWGNKEHIVCREEDVACICES